MSSALGVSWAALTSGIVFSLAISAMVLLAAIAAHDAQRAANRAVRWVWFSGIIAIVVLSLASPMRRPPPAMTLRATAAASPSASKAAAPATLSLRDRWDRVTRTLSRPVSGAIATTQAYLERVPNSVHRAIGVLWFVASVATLGVFIVSYWRVRQTLQQWPIQRIGDTDARIAPTVGPAVVGLAPSQIILPSWLLSRSPEEQRLVVTHESEHVRAGDPWLLVFACGAVALMPWNPALWYALGRLRLAVELDCDRRVLGRGIPTASYGALLIDLSALRSTLPSAMPAFSCSGSYLERRLIAMTARPSRYSAPRRAFGALIAAAAFVTACESKLPTSAEVEQMDVASAREQASKASLIEERVADYYVNGQKVSAAVAEELAPNRIKSVRIVGKSADKAGEIRIDTKESSAPSGEGVMTADGAITFERKLEGVVVSAAPGANASANIVEVRPTSPGAKPANVVAGRPLNLSEVQPRRKFDGLVVIDGKIAEQSEFDRLSPSIIASVEVLKGESGKALYSDPRAANGVIRVTTKAKQ